MYIEPRVPLRLIGSALFSSGQFTPKMNLPPRPPSSIPARQLRAVKSIHNRRHGQTYISSCAVRGLHVYRDDREEIRRELIHTWTGWTGKLSGSFYFFVRRRSFGKDSFGFVLRMRCILFPEFLTEYLLIKIYVESRINFIVTVSHTSLYRF